MLPKATIVRLLLPPLFLAPFSGLAQTATTPPEYIAITHVNVISMVPGSEIQTDMTVLLEGDRILAVEPAATIALPEAYVEIEGTGQWLIPGLVDLHAHFLSEPIEDFDFGPQHILSPYIAHGVLQIADLAATPYTNAIRDDVEAGSLRAPFIASAAMVDGVPAMRPGAREIADAAEARDVVREIAEEGFDFVKIYSQLSLKAFQAVLDAAAEVDIGVIGHIPGGRDTRPEQVIVPGFAMVAHAEEFSWRAPEKSDAEIAEIAALMVESGTALTATLFLNQRIAEQTRDPAVLESFEGLATLHPVELMLWFEQNPYIARTSPERIAELEAVARFNNSLVAALVDAGVPVFAGTDAAFIPGLAPGLSLHQELEALVGAGLSPLQALEAATVAPMEWLGVAHDRGTIAAGKRANLVLLDADPLLSIDNTRSIDKVILNGTVFERFDLDDMLAELDALYAPYRPYLSPQAQSILER